MSKQLFTFISLFTFLPLLLIGQSPCEPKPPVSICDETVVIALNDQSVVKLFASSIDDGSFSYTCDDSVPTLQVARLDQCDGDCGTDDFSSSVEFTDADVFKSFNVILRITDGLGEYSDCMSSVKVLDKTNHDEDPNTDTGNGGCTLACLDGVTVALSSEGTATIWPADFLLVQCSGQVLMTIYDENNDIVFEQTTEDVWTATSDDVDKEYTYTITHTATENTCWGKVYVVDKLDGVDNEHTSGGDGNTDETSCPDFAIDFSSYHIEEAVTFTDKTFKEVHTLLAQTYADAFNDMISANNIDPNSNDYIVAYSIEDVVVDDSADGVKIVRTVSLLDWCHYNPDNGANGIKTVTQIINITNPPSMRVADINYAEGSSSIDINKILITNDAGQATLPAFEENQNLSESINSALEELEWQGNHFQVELDKFEACHLGVSSIDIEQIRRHILDLDPLPSNAQIVAADFNENGQVTAADMIGVRNLVLEIDQCSDDSHWRFFKSQLQDDKSFSLDQLHKQSLSYSIDPSNQENIDIVAFKKGDVNLSILEDRTTKSKSIQFSTPDMQLTSGNIYEIHLNATEQMQIATADFYFDSGSDFEILGFQSDILEIESYHFNISEEKAKLVWYGMETTTVEEGRPALSMIIKSNVNNKLSEVLSGGATFFQTYESVDAKKSTKSVLNIEVQDHLDAIAADPYTVNMSQGNITINSSANSSDPIHSVEIYTMSGQRLHMQQNIGQSNYQVDLSSVADQIITYRILTTEGQVQFGKLFSNK